MKKYIKNNIKYLTLWMIFEISFAALMVIWSLIVSKALSAGMDGDLRELGRVLFGGLFFFVAMVFSFYFQNLFCSHFVSSCTYDLKEDLFSGIIRADANSYTEYNCAKYLSIFNNDVGLVAKDFFQGVPAIFAQLLLALAATVTMFFYNAYLAVFQIVISIVTSTIPILVNRKSDVVQKAYTDMLGRYNTQIKDYISAGDVLKSYHVEDRIQAVHSQINHGVENSYMELEKNRGLVYAVLTAAIYIENAMFIAFGAYLIATGHLSVAIMLGAMQITNYVSQPVKQATKLYSNYKRTKLVIDNVNKFIQDIQDSGQGKEMLLKPMPLEIEHLSFAYGDKQVLKDLSVRFEEGKKYAVIGESGSGKSTLIKIIMQQLVDYEGRVMAGGQDTRNIDRESFVKNYALIQQEMVMFEDTLRNNITMYGDYTDEEILAAAERAGLKKYIDSLYEGLDTMIGENGANCSGGERQRITIARALLRKTSVLIMDEATSSLDVDTARQIENALLANPNITVISITHKTDNNLLEKYDAVYRMQDGRLCEHTRSGRF